MGRSFIFTSLMLATTLAFGGNAKADGDGLRAWTIEEGTPPTSISNFPVPDEIDEYALCDTPDNIKWVQAGHQCLPTKQTSTSDEGEKALVIFIAGDVSSGGPDDYIDEVAEEVAQRSTGMDIRSLGRPGYEKDGLQGSGDDYGRGNGYREEVIYAMASGALRLKEASGREKAVCVGHSGGAIICADILALYPGVFDAAVLAACPCDIPRMREMRDRRPWPESISPMDVVDKIPDSTTAVLTIAAEFDERADPVLAEDFLAELKSRSIQTNLEIVDSGHGGVVRTAEFHVAIQTAVDMTLGKQ